MDDTPPETLTSVLTSALCTGLGIGASASFVHLIRTRGNFLQALKTGVLWAGSISLTTTPYYAFRDFHLVPRMRKGLNSYREERTKAVGIDKARQETLIRLYGLLDYPDTERVAESFITAAVFGGALRLVLHGRSVYFRSFFTFGLSAALLQLLVNETRLLRIRALAHSSESVDRSLTDASTKN